MLMGHGGGRFWAEVEGKGSVLKIRVSWALRSTSVGRVLSLRLVRPGQVSLWAALAPSASEASQAPCNTPTDLGTRPLRPLPPASVALGLAVASRSLAARLGVPVLAAFASTAPP